jgi:hypothetical protein
VVSLRDRQALIFLCKAKCKVASVCNLTKHHAIRAFEAEEM